MDNFIRESKERTRSERIIDRHLLIDRNDPGPNKRVKVSEEEEKIAISKESLPKISVTQAFNKLKINIKKPNQARKCIAIMNKLLSTYGNKIQSEDCFSCIISLFEHKFDEIFPLIGLAEFLTGIKSSGIIFNESQSETIECLDFIAGTVGLMHTDDSNEFNKAFRAFENKIEDVRTGSELAKWYGKGLISLKKYLNIPWSRTSMANLVRKCFRNLKAFDESTKKEILLMLDTLDR